MYLPTVRPLLAVVAAGAALTLLGACGSSPSSPAAVATGSAPATATSDTPTSSASASGAPAGTGNPSHPGGGQSSKAAPPPPTKPAAVGAKAAVKACSLVSAAEATAAMHLSGSMQTTTNSGAECEYDTSAGDSVDIEVQAVPFTADLPNAMTEMLPAAQTKRISGLGDAAVLFTPSANLAQFYLWKDGLYVVLIVDRADMASASTTAMSLGEMIAGRI
jgi:hypothetical protein